MSHRELIQNDVTFFIPRTDFMRREDYDLLDCILIGAGFTDEGVSEIGQFSFRKYYLSPEKCAALRSNLEPLPFDPAVTGKLAFYSKLELDMDTSLALGSYGVNYVDEASAGDVTMHQYSIGRHHLPQLAKLSGHGVSPSRRIVEEYAYCRFVERGGHHGMDISDWLTAEWECQERINRHLEAL